MDITQEYLKTDFLVIGGGVAGLRAAIELGRNNNVLVITKDAPRESSSEYAQGGVAVALSYEDEISIHYEDTLKAGDGLCIHPAVRTLVEEGPARIRELIFWGAEFDKEGSKLAFTQEAAHSKRRILHAQGDSTGREILRAMIEKVKSLGSVSKLDFTFTKDLIVDQGKCVGAVVLQSEPRRMLVIAARAVILATGGAGRLYERTTNPPVATGDGMAMAYRAGAAIMDMEFVQFHPTALYREGMPQFLLSEAMRGEGGMLKNIHGLRFMDAYHPARELAPRDVVTRAIFAEMAATDSKHVYLDMTHLDDGYIAKRFPRIYSTCKEYGIDITHEPIPVSPAAHYIMGGVKTNLWGATTVPGLFAAGETACTGVHGANRLASNSLLEGLVFGQRAGEAALKYASRRARGREREFHPVSISNQKAAPALTDAEITAIRSSLRKLMWEKVGIIRTKKDLTAVLRQLKQWDRILKRPQIDRTVLELKNMVTASTLIAYSALLREGSVGAHFRSDFPKKGKNWKKRTILTK